MEEYKFFKRSNAKLILNAVLILFGGLLALTGYGIKAYGRIDIAIVFWILAAVLIGLVLRLFLKKSFQK